MPSSLGAQAAEQVRRHISNLNALFKPSLKRTLGLDKPDYGEGLKVQRELCAKLEELTLRSAKDGESTDLQSYIAKALIAGRSLEKLVLHLWRQTQNLEPRWGRKQLKTELARQQRLELDYLQVGAKLNEAQKTH